MKTALDKRNISFYCSIPIQSGENSSANSKQNFSLRWKNTCYRSNTAFYRNSTTKGFSLIELLIVIAIVGVVSALLMANFVGIRQKARDSDRKSNVRQIQSGLELHFADQSFYPTQGNAYGSNAWLNNTACPTSSSLFAGGATYMQLIPCDPGGIGAWNSGNYYYFSADGATYDLVACLENPNDSDSVASFPGLPVGNTDCLSGAYFHVTSP